MNNVQRVAYHEASLILLNSLVESRRLALGLYEVTFYTSKVNGRHYELVTQVTAFSTRMAELLAFHKIRRGWIRQSAQRRESA